MGRTKITKKLTNIIKESPPESTFDLLREIIYPLKPPYTEEIQVIIIDYYVTEDKGKGILKDVPYQGKLPIGGKKSHQEITNIIYDFEKFPKRLQSLILAYVDHIKS